MRHRVYGKKLGRNKNERISLFKNLMQELFLHGTITTSKTKASAIKGEVDKVINLAKSKTSQRLIQAFFANKFLQERIIKEIAPKLTNRNSGYTSTVKVGVRDGDRTTLVRVSLIGMEEMKPLEKKVAKKEVMTEKNMTVAKEDSVTKTVAKKSPLKKVLKRKATKK